MGRITSKGQVTIPVEIRDRLGLHAGSVVRMDIDGDEVVGITDFLALLKAWGPNPGDPADIDGDGMVGIEDFLELLAHWGPC